jgi:hypothetical protein
MVTSGDLKVIRDWPDVEGIGMSTKIVEYGGRFFALLTQDMDPDDDDQMLKLFKASPFFAIGVMSLGERQIQTWVTEEKWSDELQDYVPLMECDESCDGVQCRKAIAKTHEVSDASLAEKMLLDYLNA